MEENRYFREALAGFTHEAASGGAIRHLADRGYTVRQIAERLDFPTPIERVRQEVWEHLLDTGVILREEPGKGARKEKASYVKEYDRYGKVTFRRVVESEGNSADLTVDCWAEREAVYRVPAAARQGSTCGSELTEDYRHVCVEGSTCGSELTEDYRHVCVEGSTCGREPTEDYGHVCREGGPGEAGAPSGEGISVESLMARLKAGTEANGEEFSYASCDFGLTARAYPERYQAMLAALGPAREYVEGLPWERRVYHRLNARMMEILALLAGAGLYQGECFFLKTQEKIRITGVCNESG